MASKLDIFSFGTSFTNNVDQIANTTPAADLTTINTALQAAASLAGATNAIVGEAGAGAAYSAGVVALATQIVKFGRDIHNGSPYIDQIGDFVGVVGDLAMRWRLAWP